MAPNNNIPLFAPQKNVALFTCSPSHEQHDATTFSANSRLPVPIETPERCPTSIQQEKLQSPSIARFPVNNVVRMPHTVLTEPILDGPAVNAGFSWQQAQNLNYLREKNRLELAKRWEEKNMDLKFQISLELWRRSVNSAVEPLPFSGNGSDGEVIAPSTRMGQMDFQKISAEFICKMQLVRERDARHHDELFYREPGTLRHASITQGNVKQAYELFIYRRISPEIDIPQTTLDRAYRLMLYAVPTVAESGLRQLTEYEIPFQNGIFDLATGLFEPCTMWRCFLRFPMEFAFNPNAPAPVAFETLLANMCGGDEAKMLHAYEELGALMSGVKTLKKLFVHQGVTNAGKTRLAAIFLSIIGEENVLAVDSLSDVTDEFITKNAGKYRVVFIEELPDKRMTVNQATTLKSFTSGTMLQHAPEFKILMCTNHRITTGSDGTLAPAMKSRISTLPFVSAMDESAPYFEDFEENHLAQEIPSIARKAMEAFACVVRNGKRFTHDFPVNDVVEEAAVPVELTSAEQERINSILDQPPTPPLRDHLAEVLARLFELTETLNHDLTTEKIFATLNDVSPRIVANAASLGKRLQAHYGDKLQSGRNTVGKPCYNLRLRIPVVPSSQE